MDNRVGFCSSNERFVKNFALILHTVLPSDLKQIRLFKNQHDWWEVEYPRTEVTHAALLGYLFGKKTGYMLTGAQE